MQARTLMLVTGLCASLAAAAANAPPGAPARIPAPQDRAFAGQLHLSVDATDIEHRVVHVHETITGLRSEAVLLYPQWLPGHHAPQGPIDRFAGLKISAQGAPVRWTRDPVQVYAFHLQPAPNLSSVDIDFDYLSPTSEKVGEPEIGHDVMILEWNELVLYPAGYFMRQIPVDVQLTLPTGFSFGTALEPSGPAAAQTHFKSVSLETLVDSPLYAGRYSARFDLDPGAAAPVHLNIFADRPEQIALTPHLLDVHRALVQQAYRLFGSHHYSHYDFLLSVSNEVEEQGLEHHQSSEDGLDSEALTKWDEDAYDHDLLSHEFTHSWNGKFRRPADQLVPNFNVPLQDSLLWVYEGQTQYWGQILAARSGLWSKQQLFDSLAKVAAEFEHERGRRWRALEDTTNDEIINPRRPMSWIDWQRFEDYYMEGQLIWLDADTLIRERSNGQHSLDDFARQFFGINDGSFVPVPYTFEAVVKALNAVQPYEWAAFLHQRLDSVGQPVPLDGFKRGGYKLVYTDVPNELMKARDGHDKTVNVEFSIGLLIQDRSDKSDMDGSITQVLWDSPAFKAGLTEGMQILAVNGLAYSADRLQAAIRASKGSQDSIELMVKNGDRFWVAKLDYHDGPRYPHLERDGTTPARLDDIAAPKS